VNTFLEHTEKVDLSSYRPIKIQQEPISRFSR